MGNLFVFISSIVISWHTFSVAPKYNESQIRPFLSNFLRQKQASLIK